MSVLFSNTIEYPNDIPEAVVVKHPIDKVLSNTRLMVDEGQEAVTRTDRDRGHVHEDGEHVLYQESGMFLDDAMGILTNQRLFTCKTYFVNTEGAYDIQWGAPDLYYSLHHPNVSSYHFGLSGNMSYEITDAAKVVETYASKKDYLTKNMLEELITSVVAEVIKSNISETIKNNHIDIYYIDDYMTMLSEVLGKTVGKVLFETGIRIRSFDVVNLVKNSEWEREPMDEVSVGSMETFQHMTASEKRHFFEYFNHFLDAEERALLEEVTHEGRTES